MPKTLEISTFLACFQCSSVLHFVVLNIIIFDYERGVWRGGFDTKLRVFAENVRILCVFIYFRETGLDRTIVALLRLDGVKYESRAISILLAAYKILRRIRRCAVEHLLVLRNA